MVRVRVNGNNNLKSMKLVLMQHDKGSRGGDSSPSGLAVLQSLRQQLARPLERLNKVTIIRFELRRCNIGCGCSLPRLGQEKDFWSLSAVEVLYYWLQWRTERKARAELAGM